MRFDRSNFYNLEIVDDIQEYDLVMTSFDKFEINRPTTFYTVLESDLKRPDIISIKNYGKMDYWWIIFKINGIDDPQNDLSAGDVLKIPDVIDVEDWYLAIRKKS